jgi:hypothetical protein
MPKIGVVQQVPEYSQRTVLPNLLRVWHKTIEKFAGHLLVSHCLLRENIHQVGLHTISMPILDERLYRDSR